MLIRPAIETDLPEVMELLKGMDDDIGIDPIQAMKIWRKMTEYPYYKVFVVEDNKLNVIGTCSLIIIENFGHNGAKLAIVESMIVSPTYRGRGIGRQLMHFVMAKAKAENCYKLTLSSNKKRVGAHEFYQELGFQQHGLSFTIEVGNND